MVLNEKTRTFEEKKTRFTVLIFSEKGNKQAGEVNLNVAELLNSKQKQLEVVRSLEKCPDKNAKISLQLTAYMKEEIAPDKVSGQSDLSSKAEEQSRLRESSIQLPPNFKKKGVEEPSFSKKKQESASVSSANPPKSDRVPSLNKDAKERLRLEEENRRLKNEMGEMRELEFENETLRKRLEEAEKKSHSYYSKKWEELRGECGETKKKARTVEALQQKKEELEREMCECKEQMGRILNFAITSGNHEMSEAVYAIYQNARP